MNKDLIPLATPSGAEQWSHCPASIALSVGIEDSGSLEASAGTLAHSAAASALINKTDLPDIEDDAVKTYVDIIRHLSPNLEYHVEERVLGLGTSGGVDCWTYDGVTLTVFDFKYGEGKKVSAIENKQLLMYAVLICAQNGLSPEWVKLMVIQPRIIILSDGETHFKNITEDLIAGEELNVWHEYFLNALTEVAKAEKMEMGDWCQFCRAKSRCPLYHIKAEETLPALTQAFEVMKTDRLVSILKQKSKIETFLKKGSHYIFEQLEKGAVIQGAMLVPARSNREWDTALSREDLIRELLLRGIESPLEESIIGITAAEKVADISDLVVKPDKGMSVKFL